MKSEIGIKKGSLLWKAHINFIMVKRFTKKIA